MIWIVSLIIICATILAAIYLINMADVNNGWLYRDRTRDIDNNVKKILRMLEDKNHDR